MSGLDAALWYLESETQPIHVGALLRIEDYPSPKLGFEGFRRLLETRLDRVPLLFDIVVPSPIPFALPYWKRQETIDLDSHLSLVTLEGEQDSENDDDREVDRLLADFLARPLPRDRPAWAMTYVQGGDGRSDFVMMKVHHALLDGSLGIESLVSLLDLAPDVISGPGLEREGVRRSSSADTQDNSAGESVSFFQSLLDLPGEIVTRARSASLVGDTLSSISKAIAGDDVDAVLRELNFGAPRFSVSGALGERRSVVRWSLDLGELASLARSQRMTVNEVVLAICGYAHAQYLKEQGDEDWKREPIALMPLSTRRNLAATASQNQVSAQLVTLPVVLDDPLEQLRRAREVSRRAKELHSQIGPNLFAALASVVTTPLLGSLSRLISQSKVFDRIDPIFNMVVSNVPGSPVQLFAGESSIGEIVPFGPVVEGAPINLTIMSYLDRMFFGLVVDGDLVSEPTRFRDHFLDGQEWLQSALV